MSEPKRWIIEWDDAKGCSCAQKEHPEGDFVYYSAYAEIKAELRRKAIDSISEIGQLGEQSAEIAYLKADVERLRKAGDIIARIIAPPAHGPGEWDGEWYAWHNAKSGVLSAETPPNTPPPAL